MKLLSRDKLKSKHEKSNLGKLKYFLLYLLAILRVNGDGDQNIFNTIKKLTSPVPIEAQSIEEFLVEDVYTNPNFKYNRD